MNNLDKRIEETQKIVDDKTVFGTIIGNSVIIENQLSIMKTLKELTEKIDSINNHINSPHARYEIPN